MSKLLRKISAGVLSIALVAGLVIPAMDVEAAETNTSSDSENVTVYGQAPVKGEYFDYTARLSVTVVVSSPAASANAGAGKSANTKSMEKRLLSAFLNMLLIPSNLW